MEYLHHASYVHKPACVKVRLLAWGALIKAHLSGVCYYRSTYPGCIEVKVLGVRLAACEDGFKHRDTN